MILLKEYRVRIMAPDGYDEDYPAHKDDEASKAADSAVSEAEQNISDLLPEGYYAKIEEA